MQVPGKKFQVEGKGCASIRTSLHTYLSEQALAPRYGDISSVVHGGTRLPLPWVRWVSRLRAGPLFTCTGHMLVSPVGSH